VPEPRTTTAPPARQATAILAIICISYFMVILDNSIIFTGLPRIEAAMRFSPAGLTWVQDAYTLVFGGLLLLGARAGDIAGRRRMFTAGLVLFGLASLLAGAAPAAWWLVSARAVQGVGAAILAPSSLALLTATFTEGRQRARAVAAVRSILSGYRRRGWPARGPGADRRPAHGAPDDSKAIPLPELERLWSRRDLPLRERSLWRLPYDSAAWRQGVRRDAPPGAPPPASHPGSCAGRPGRGRPALRGAA
jgi:hypothetical protein